MNQYSEVESHDYVLDEFYDETQYCQSAEYSEEYYILESRIYLQNQYYGRWAAEKWLLRLCPRVHLTTCHFDG